MKLSEKKKQALFEAIHSEVVNARIALESRLRPSEDFILAKVEHKIWDNVCEVLNLEKSE